MSKRSAVKIYFGSVIIEGFVQLPDASGRFYYASYLNFNRDNGKVKLNAKHVENSNSNWGSGSLR